MLHVGFIYLKHFNFSYFILSNENLNIEHEVCEIQQNILLKQTLISSCRTVLVCVCIQSNIQHVVQVGDVTNSQSQDFNLGQLFVRWECGEEFPQLREGHVEGHDPDPLPGGMRGSIPGGGAPLASPLLPGARSVLSAEHELGWHGPARTGVRVLLSPMDRFLLVREKKLFYFYDMTFSGFLFVYFIVFIFLVVKFNLPYLFFYNTILVFEIKKLKNVTIKNSCII